MVERAGATALRGDGEIEQGSGPKSAQPQGDSGDAAGDKGGESLRTGYQLDAEQRENLGRIRTQEFKDEADRAEAERRFWTQISPPMGFNPVTVEPAADVVESGDFTAWPAETAPAEPSPANNEADHSAMIDRIDDIAEAAEIDERTLAGDMRDTMLDIFRNRHKAWGAMSPGEQRDVAVAIDGAVKLTIRKAVRAIAAGDKTTVTAQLGQYTDKGGGEITGAIKLVGVTDNNILALHRAAGKTVLIVVADEGPYLGERAPVEFDPDHPELEFDAGDDREAGGGAGSSATAGDGERAEGEEEDEAEAQPDEAEQLYQRAVAAVREHDKASISWVQRNLQVGYTVAQGLIERMEKEGIVSPADSSSRRKVLPFDPPGDNGERGDETGGGASASTESA